MDQDDQYQLLREHVYDWMIEFVENDVSFNGHNYHKDHPNVDISLLALNGLSNAVHLVEKALNNVNTDLVQSRYFTYVLSDEPKSPTYLGDNSLKYALWNVYYWLRKSYNEINQNNKITNP